MREIYVLVTTTCNYGELENEVEVYETYEEAIEGKIRQKLNTAAFFFTDEDEWEVEEEEMTYYAHHIYDISTRYILIQIFQREIGE